MVEHNPDTTGELFGDDPEYHDSARVYPLVADAGNEQLLAEWLESVGEFEIVRQPTSISDGAFDLCIVDRGGLRQNYEALRERKQSEQPVLLPYLLLLPEDDPEFLQDESGQLPDTLVQQTIDEMLSLPVRQFELRWRIESLLRMRGQTRTLANRERKLRRFRRAVTAAGHAIYMTDTDGTITYVNSAFERITGYTEGEAVGATPRILNSGEMPEEYFEELWETIQSGGVWEEEVTNERKNGERYHANQTIAPVPGPDGDIEEFVAIQTDITEHKERQQQLQASRERYESLFASIQDAILVADTDRRIIECNAGFVETFGYTLEEIEGKPTSFLYADEAEFDEMGTEINHHTDGRKFTKTVTYETKFGYTFPGETNVSDLSDAEGNLIGHIGVIRDISERQDRLQQLKMIDRVLRHNLHNEMNVILGRAEQIQATANGEPIEHAATIIESGNRLIQTTDKERDVTKFLADNPRPRSRDIVPLVTTTVAELREQYPDADISVDVPGERTAFAVNPFERVIEELVENAIVHSDQDTPSVTVRLECDGETVRIRVADDGPGVPEIEQQVLTEGEEMQPLYHGRGFGLWLVHLLVEHSGGTLTVEDNEPRGSIVTVQLSKAQRRDHAMR